MVTTRPFISKSSSPITDPVVTVASSLITVGITFTFMFHSCFSSLARSRYFIIIIIIIIIIIYYYYYLLL